MHEVVAMSHTWKVTVRRGVNSPCVQWRMFEVLSYVLLGAWRVVGVYMGMNVGCSASHPKSGQCRGEQKDQLDKPG